MSVMSRALNKASSGMPGGGAVGGGRLGEEGLSLKTKISAGLLVLAVVAGGASWKMGLFDQVSGKSDSAAALRGETAAAAPPQAVQPRPVATKVEGGSAPVAAAPTVQSPAAPPGPVDEALAVAVAVAAGKPAAETPVKASPASGDKAKDVLALLAGEPKKVPVPFQVGKAAVDSGKTAQAEGKPAAKSAAEKPDAGEPVKAPSKEGGSKLADDSTGGDEGGTQSDAKRKVAERIQHSAKLVNLFFKSVQSGELGQAEKHLVELEKQRGADNPFLLNMRGFWMISQGRYQEAYPYLEQVLKLQPGNLEAGTNMVMVEIQTGRREEARKRIQGLLGQYPGNERLRRLLIGLH
ncbi:MAG: tetratricopeptide repeat protein [Magnetococcales bacterium]|nr:tetratricopeptide repeat protein [Magnetococcales bacterium]